ncbi:TraB/GumN family protein [Steroidobacter sp. S1-65]|uniref:TraB/GumN family protein n=1 Tax=Steroidobacter gossypii TaxID=2805490 RepID=A0ABS1X3Y1_9GAMM|nr:TraB/GumN family protein [Steroidobacter gossypii]MBM0107934.1 TraB/GumN family protein [Steroidobacter gossypii]
MKKILVALCALWFSAGAGAADQQQHSLWSLKGRSNTVYLLGSVHFLSKSERLPAALEQAYEDSEVLLMEIDMDDLDPAETQQVTLELGMLPAGQSLEQQLGKETYSRLATRAQDVGIDPALLNRFQPWFAAMTLVQLQLMKMGLAPDSGIEQRFTTRAVADKKPIHGLETLREQLGMLAGLPAPQQREFLLYSIDDADRIAEEIDELLSAWRRGDSKALADLLAEGFEQYPDLYRPLTTDRNRRWVSQVEQLLDDKDDYLVVVGTLHLVGKDSLVELLEGKGHKVTQH